MKKIFYIFLAATVLLTACDKETPSSSSETSITFNITGNLQISFMKGTDSVAYTLTGARSGGKLIPSSSETWITGYDTSVDGILYFTVEENPVKEARSAILSLTYIYDGGETSAQINIIQEASNAIIFEASYAGGFYYGNIYSESPRYYTWLSENPLQGNGLGAGTNYCFDIYSSTPGDMNMIAPAPGTYIFNATTEEGTFGSRESRLVNGSTGDMTFFREGTLVITQEGDNYHYAAELIDSTGVLHKIFYTGRVSLINVSNPYTSTLTDDYELDLDGASLVAYYFGQYYGASTSNWSGTIVPAGGNGDAFQFDLCASLAFNFEAGFPTGVFTIDDSLDESTSLYGFNDIMGSDIGTWYLEWSGYNKTGRVAPIVSGIIDISREGDIYTFTLDGNDDAGNAVTASWSGVPECSDRTGNAVPEPAALSALPLR